MIQSVADTRTPFVDESFVATYWDVGADEYHAHAPQSVSHSDSEVFFNDPSLYEQRCVLKTHIRESSPALEIGTLFHDVALGLPYECDRSNYRQHTIALWKPCDVPGHEPDATSSSGSRYWHSGAGVIRESDHWGIVRSCYWELEGMDSDQFGGCGFCSWNNFIYDTGDFRPIPRSILNAQGHKKGAAWVAWEEQHGCLPLLKAVDGDKGWSIIPEMVSAVRSHSAANSLLFKNDGDNEVSILHRHPATGLLLRCRIDALRPGLAIADLKTIRAGGCHPKRFSSSAYSMGYHRQAAWYQDAVYAVTGTRLPFVFIAVDKESFRVECFEVTESFIEQGRCENEKVLRRMAECFRRGKFVSPTHGRVLTLSAPRWANYESEWEYTDEE